MSKHHRHHRSSEHERESGDTQLMNPPAGDNAAASEENGERFNVMTAFQNARAFAGDVRQKAVASARATDQAIQSHPYKALAIAAGIGVLVGLFLSRRGSRDA